MGDELVEPVDRDAVTAGRGTRRCAPRTAASSSTSAWPSSVAVAVVDAVDAQRLEARRQRVDLAQEVLRRRTGPRRARSAGCSMSRPAACRRRRARRAAGSSPSCRPGRRARTRRCRRRSRPAEQLDGVLVAERADQRRVLDEGAEVLPARASRARARRAGGSCRRRTRRRGRRPGLSARAACRRKNPPGRCGRAPAPANVVQPVDGLLLRREVGVRPVRFERRVRRTAAAARGSRRISAAEICGFALGEADPVHGSRPWSCWRCLPSCTG